MNEKFLGMSLSVHVGKKASTISHQSESHGIFKSFGLAITISGVNYG